jgi:serine/threonine-protein kinase RsbT
VAVTRSETFPVRTEHDIVLARQAVRRLAQEAGFGLVDQTKMVTAASELARNSVIYGGGGEMACELLLEGARKGLRLSFTDEGPGIADLSLAMKDGWTTGSSKGHGLWAGTRLWNE